MPVYSPTSSTPLRSVFLLLIVSMLCSCSGAPERVERPLLEDNVGTVSLETSAADPSSARLLDVAVQVFAIEQQDAENSEEGEQPVSESAIGDWYFAEILEIESQYLPTVMRNTLIQSNQWNAVRVLPQSDASIDLNLAATIISSDGNFLDVQVRATDSTGREWLNKQYSEINPTEAFAPGMLADPNYEGIYQDSDEDPFQNLYNQIANDLLAVQRSLSDDEMLTIQRVSELRHASDLSPETFSELLVEDEQGYATVNRLLADSDPMLARIARMRLRHHVFIDTLDEYYATLNLDMQPVYDLWRLYSREQILELEAEQTRDQGKSRSSGGFSAINNNYYRYTQNKLFEQEWAELASGFTQELEPSIIELNNRVYGLSGSVDDQYVQWREILKQFYIRERGANF